MKRRYQSAIIALCASLVAHGMGLFALVHWELNTRERSMAPARFAPQQLPGSTASDEPQPLRPPPDPIPEPKLPSSVMDAELFGERGGKGKAVDSSAGDVPMQARQTPDETQAALSKNPGQNGESSPPGSPISQSAVPSTDTPATGMIAFGLPVDPSAPFGAPPAPAPTPFPPMQFKEKPPELIAIIVPEPESSIIKSDVTQTVSPSTRPTDAKPPTQPINLANAAPTTSPLTDPTTTQPTRIAQSEPNSEQLPVGQMPTTTQPSLIKHPTTRPTRALPGTAIASIDAGGPPLPAARAPGDIGHKSESEDDPFSTTPGFTYRDGKVEARDGRKVKMVKPRFTQAGWLALAAMESPRITMAVTIDETGKVTNVTHIHPSHINEIDLPIVRALWEWEFEPKLDEAGHPKADVQIIDLVWR